MTRISLADADRVYACSEACDILRHRVRNDKLEVYSQALIALQSDLGEEADDVFWKPFFSLARRCFFEACSAPIPLNHRWAFGGEAVAGLRSQVKNCKHVYPRHEDAAAGLLARAEALSSCDENPLLEQITRVCETAGAASIALVVKEPRIIPHAEDALRRCKSTAKVDVVGVSQLRGDARHDLLIVLGPTRWFPDYVFTAPRARAVHVIHFASLRDRWAPARTFADPHDGSGSAPRLHGRLPLEVRDEAPVEAFTPVSHDPEEVLPDIDWHWVAKRYGARPSAGWDRDYDYVPARLFLFESGHFMFVGADEGERTLVIDPDAEGGPKVTRYPPDRVRPGMYLLARSGNLGGYGDYIVEVANGILGPEAERLRRIQRVWKRRLRKEVIASDLLSVSVRLLDLGSNRANESNLRNWLSPRNIKTQYPEDFDAILKLVSLGDKSKKIWRAMATIDRAHKRAGQRILKLLIATVGGAGLEELQRLGRMDFSLDGDARVSISALRVASVHQEALVVPAARLGRLLVGEHPIWLG